MNPAVRTYLKELGGAGAAYVVVLGLAITALQGHPAAGWRVPVALAPMLPALFAVAAIARFLGRIDELQRRIQLEALSFAFAGTAVLTFSYGFLELVGFPRLSWFLVWPLMALLWLLGLAFSTRRYR